MASYVYMRTEPTLFTVGFYDPDGQWNTDSDHDSKDEAAARVRWLNGGNDNHREPSYTDIVDVPTLDDFENDEIAEALADAEASIGENPQLGWKHLDDKTRNDWIDIVAKARAYLIDSHYLV